MSEDRITSSTPGALSFGGVLCTLYQDSPQESWSDGDFTPTIRLRCNWDERMALWDSLLGIQYPFNNYPSRCNKLGAMGLGSLYMTAAGPVYPYAIVTAGFSTRTPEQADAEKLITERLEPTAEFLTTDYSKFQWAGANGGEDGDDLEPDEAPGKLIRGFDYILTYYNLQTIPAALLSLQGSCNSVAVTTSTLGLTFPAQTCRVDGAVPEREITTQGSEGWRLSLHFNIRYTGWNKYYRAKTQAWEYQKVKSTGAIFYSYPPVNIQALLP